MPTFARLRADLYRRGRSRLLLALALPLLLPAACRRQKAQTLPIETAAVTRRTIVSEATASGQVEPINVIEVKSKSSGQIIEMPVETGSKVSRGQLLIQLDPRDVQQQLAQAEADSVAAAAKLAVSKAQKERNDKMFADKIITAQEYEAAQLDYANSVASMIRSRSAVDIAAPTWPKIGISAAFATKLTATTSTTNTVYQPGRFAISRIWLKAR